MSLVLLFFSPSCKEHSVNVDPFGLRGEVTGFWLPLFENDTLEVYVNTGTAIHLGDPSFEITRIPEANLSSFQVWVDSQYARDSLFVYFPIDIECEVIENEFTCYSTEYIVENADATTFRYLGNGYATDGNELYINGRIVEGNNGEGF